VFLAAALALGPGAAGLGADDAALTVHLVDGQTKAGQTLSLASGRLALEAAGGQPAGQWPLADVALVDFHRPPAAAADDAAWVRVTGGVLRGSAEAFDGQAFKVVGGDFGNLSLPAACVEAVVWIPAAAQRLEEAETPTDVVILKNLDRVSGTLNTLDAEKVKFHSDLGLLELERGRVAAIKIAAPKAGRPKGGLPALKVELLSGTAVELSDAQISGGALKGTLPGGPAVAVALDKVARLEVVGGRLVPLDGLEPAAYEQNSLDILKWQIKRGLNVLGQPMRLRADDGKTVQTFTRGLGVHGPCRIEYRLDGQYERFLAAVGLDESAGQWADVNLVVKVDGREVFRADHVKWPEAARQVNVGLAGAKQLELIVEAGENFDVQDRVNWAEARLIRAGASR
jgi:hypothetical protein